VTSMDSPGAQSLHQAAAPHKQLALHHRPAQSSALHCCTTQIQKSDDLPQAHGMHHKPYVAQQQFNRNPLRLSPVGSPATGPGRFSLCSTLSCTVRVVILSHGHMLCIHHRLPVSRSFKHIMLIDKRKPVDPACSCRVHAPADNITCAMPCCSMCRHLQCTAELCYKMIGEGGWDVRVLTMQHCSNSRRA